MTSLLAFREAVDQPLPSASSGARPVEADAAYAARPSGIRVELADAVRFGALADDWMSLAARACVPNAFMDPAVALAVAEAWPHPVRVLLAWRDGEPPAAPALVGAWLLVERRARLSWPWRALVGPPCPVAYLGTPVVDRDEAQAVLAAIFAMMRTSPDLPKLLVAGDVSDEPVIMEPLRSALQQGGGAFATIERRRRAKLETSLDPEAYWAASMSARHRREFARLRRQLAGLGELALVISHEPAAVEADVEAFLALEASGWKGARGSALTNDPATAAFTRRIATGLAERGQISVLSLRLNGTPAAMGLQLYSGAGAFTWRMAYDERYRRFSPGILLLEDTTLHLLRNPAIRSTDSCNHLDTGYQAERWGERHEVLDLLIDAGPAKPLRLALLAGRERLLRHCRAIVRHAYHQAQRRRKELLKRLRPRSGSKPETGG